MLDILATIPSKKRQTPSGWYSFNAVCCHHRGHKPDRRGRAGILFHEETNWTYSCFNCHFKCSFILGRRLSKNCQLLLAWCNLDPDEIERISFESFSQRDLIKTLVRREKPKLIHFDQKSLPDGSVKLDSRLSEHKIHIDYLASRGLSEHDYTFYVCEDSSRQGIIIPYYWEGVIVGHTSRYYDNRVPKYISEQQPGYVFNMDAQHPDWSVCILAEGQFDAISIGGCAYMGSNISNEQAITLSKLRKTVIVVPDRDKSGLAICDRALELNYKVSIPNWHDDIKDINDAVRRYGKLATLLSILECATTSKIKIEMMKRRVL